MLLEGHEIRVKYLFLLIYFILVSRFVLNFVPFSVDLIYTQLCAFWVVSLCRGVREIVALQISRGFWSTLFLFPKTLLSVMKYICTLQAQYGNFSISPKHMLRKSFHFKRSMKNSFLFVTHRTKGYVVLPCFTAHMSFLSDMSKQKRDFYSGCRTRFYQKLRPWAALKFWK